VAVEEHRNPKPGQLLVANIRPEQASPGKQNSKTVQREFNAEKEGLQGSKPKLYKGALMRREGLQETNSKLYKGN
ncbi:hypothetical protein AVEN_197572-1, partial [Araneus ventricosus]